MNKVYLDTYYMTIYEELKQSDGTESYYSRLMFNPSTSTVSGYVTTKQELKEKIDERISNIVRAEDFTVTETEHGWEYERFVKWLDEDGYDYELVEEGQHTDHEIYSVEISYYEEVRNIMKKLD